MVVENNVVFPYYTLVIYSVKFYFCPIILKERTFHTVVFPIIKEATEKGLFVRWHGPFVYIYGKKLSSY